ncbi:MAG: host attachment protein [Sulfitobacter sp.]
MKPIVTWVILANARIIRVLSHQGPGKGLAAMADKCWHATEASRPRDKAGMGHSIAGPGVAAVEQTDAKLINDTRFAKEVMAHLSQAYVAKAFDRLILISGPHMLGLMRAEMDAPLHKPLVGEIPKDLSAQSLAQVEAHLGELIAI